MRSTLSEIFNYKNPNIYEISRSQLRTKKKDKIFYLEVLIDEIIKDFSKEIELNELKKTLLNILFQNFLQVQEIFLFL